jgi:predicted nucleotidyltransferase
MDRDLVTLESERSKIICLLVENLNVDVNFAQIIASKLPTGCKGLLLFGSRARKDFGPDSDIDLLALTDSSNASRSIGSANISVMTHSQLRDATGSVFGYHLRRDGRVLYEEAGELSEILSHLEAPEFEVVAERLRHFGLIFNAPKLDRQKYLLGLTKLARHLCRTALFAESIQQGEPCYSVRDLSIKLQTPSLVSKLSSHQATQEPATLKLLDELNELLASIVGTTEPFSDPSLQHLIIRTWYEDEDLAWLATMAIMSQDAPLEYTVLPKVLM